MRISDWSSDVCSSDLQEFIETAPGNAVARVAEIFERRQRRALHAEHRTDVEEDRRPQPQFLRTGAERDIELDPPLIIGAPAERVVDLARSEEHMSELQSLMRTSYAVFCLKKNR